MTAAFPESPSALRRIRRIGRIRRAATLAGIAFALAGAAWAWSYPGIIEAAARAQLGLGAGPVVRSTRTLALTFLLSLLPLGLLVYGMSTIARLFHAFARGEVFSVENANCIGRLGWTFVLAALATTPFRTVLGLVLQLDSLPGYGSLTWLSASRR